MVEETVALVKKKRKKEKKIVMRYLVNIGRII